jgi:putative tricarboxylic transport membrane protein
MRGTRAGAVARTVVVVMLLALVTGGCAGLGADRRLRILVPNSAGGGYDVTARVAAHVLTLDGITAPPQVFNLLGGGGTVALTRLQHESGNPDLVMMMGLGVVGASVTTGGGVGVTAATPIARLVEEPEGVMVRADSRFRTIDDVISAWQAPSPPLRVGGGSLPGGPDFLMSMRLARAAEIDPAGVIYVAHDGGGELLPALLHGSVDFAVSGVREYTEQLRSGQLRLLAVSGRERMSTIDAPTLLEAGYDVVFTNWRGVIAAPDVSEADRNRLIEHFTALHQSPRWQVELTRNGWQDALLTGDAFGAFLVEQDASVRHDLRELGLG